MRLPEADTIIARALEVADEVDVVLSKRTWSTAEVNDLPDSAFLFVESGGMKDGSGRTMPRHLRHFPVRDKNGKLDAAHVRNAIARIPQSKVPGLSAADKTKLQDKARRLLASIK